MKKIVEGEEKEVEETSEETTPGYLEAVYHLYSMATSMVRWSFACGPLIAAEVRSCHRSHRFSAALNSRSARFSISTESVSTVIRICAAS